MVKSIKLIPIVLFIIITLAIPCSFAADLNNSFENSNFISEDSSNSLSESLAISNRDSGSSYSINSNDVVSTYSDDNVYDWYVSASANETGDGSKLNPFKTVQEGLTANTGGQSIYISNGTYNVVNYELTKNVTLIGENTNGVLLDANKSGHIFTMYDTVTVNLNNLSLVNGDSSALDQEGGAIMKFNGTLNANYCNFYNNHATFAGSIYNNRGELNLDYCNFKNSTIYREGGCDGGAAIYTLYGDLIITNCNFEDNIAYGQDGGAIYQNKAVLTLINSTFKNNQATGSFYGGAIYFNDKSKTNIDNCSFINNSAYKGGALYSTVGSMYVLGNLIVNNCLFDSNNARVSGGAIFNDGLYSSIYVKNSNFINNSAVDGGVIYNNLATVYLNNNAMANCSGINGNYIYNSGGKVANTYLTFLNNETVKVDNEQNILINASITDDNGNPISGGIVNFVVNGLSIANVSVVEGIATVNYTISKEGQYFVNGSYSLADSNQLFVKTGLLDTNASEYLNTVVIASDFIESYGASKNFTATVLDERGNAVVGVNVVFKLINALGDSKVYWSTTNTEGVAKLLINLIPGVFTIESVFAGDSTYVGSSNNSSVIIHSVNKSSAILNAPAFTKSYNEARNFTATLSDLNGTAIIGEELSLTLYNALGNSKVYWATTNTEGVAKLAINLIPGNWYIVSAFGGNSIYDSAYANSTVTVTAQ